MAGETTTQPPNADISNDAKPKPANSASTSVEHEKLEVKTRSGPKGETLEQLIALRSAVLMPPGVQLTNELSKTLPPNTVLCYVGDISTTNNIEIWCYCGAPSMRSDGSIFPSAVGQSSLLERVTVSLSTYAGDT